MKILTRNSQKDKNTQIGLILHRDCPNTILYVYIRNSKRIGEWNKNKMHPHCNRWKYFILSLKSHCHRQCVLNRFWLCVIPWAVDLHSLLSMWFSRHEYWSGLPFSTPGDFPDPGIKPVSLASPLLAGEFFATVPPGIPYLYTPYHNFFMHSSIDRHWGCFCILAIEKKCYNEHWNEYIFSN